MQSRSPVPFSAKKKKFLLSMDLIMLCLINYLVGSKHSGPVSQIHVNLSVVTWADRDTQKPRR